MEEAKKNTRKIRAPDRYKEDGTYYSGPKNPKEYFKQYYDSKGVEEIACPCCNKMIRRAYMYKHSKTKKCTPIPQAQEEIVGDAS
jgi:hypothetical protein